MRVVYRFPSVTEYDFVTASVDVDTTFESQLRTIHQEHINKINTWLKERDILQPMGKMYYHRDPMVRSILSTLVLTFSNDADALLFVMSFDNAKMEM